MMAEDAPKARDGRRPCGARGTLRVRCAAGIGGSKPRAEGGPRAARRAIDARHAAPRPSADKGS